MSICIIISIKILRIEFKFEYTISKESVSHVLVQKKATDSSTKGSPRALVYDAKWSMFSPNSIWYLHEYQAGNLFPLPAMENAGTRGIASSRVELVPQVQLSQYQNAQTFAFYVFSDVHRFLSIKIAHWTSKNITLPSHDSICHWISSQLWCRIYTSFVKATSFKWKCLELVPCACLRLPNKAWFSYIVIHQRPLVIRFPDHRGLSPIAYDLWKSHCRRPTGFIPDRWESQTCLTFPMVSDER